MVNILKTDLFFRHENEDQCCSSKVQAPDEGPVLQRNTPLQKRQPAGSLYSLCYWRRRRRRPLQTGTGECLLFPRSIHSTQSHVCRRFSFIVEMGIEPPCFYLNNPVSTNCNLCLFFFNPRPGGGGSPRATAPGSLPYKQSMKSSLEMTQKNQNAELPTAEELKTRQE